MAKYRSTSNHLVWNTVLGCLLILPIGISTSYILEETFFKILAALISLIIIGLLINDMRVNTFSVLFKNEGLYVEYRFIPKSLYILYTDIFELKYISVINSPSLNKIQFKDGEKKRVLNFKSIEYDKYISFVKWIKSKNENIKLTVEPSDNYMNHRLQEVYGFPYRKI